MKKIALLCVVACFSLLHAQQKTFKVEVEQTVVGSNLYIDVFIQKLQGADFPLGSSNFTFFVNNVDLNLSGVQIDHSQDGPYDLQTDPKYYDMTKGYGDNYLVLNVKSVLNHTSPGQLVTSIRTQVGRLVVPITNPAGFNTLTWRIQPAAINTAGYNTWTGVKHLCDFINPAPNFPLCEVPQKPMLNASNTSVCNGPVTLSSGYSGENQWYVDGNLLDGVNGSTYVTSQPGTYTVVAKNYSCTSQPSDPIVLQGAPSTAPTISGQPLVCTNHVFTYQATSPNGGTYLWSASNGASIVSSPGQPQVSVSFPQHGNYTLTVTETLDNGCQVTNTYQVQAEATPQTPVIVLNGADLQIQSYSGGNIQWFFDGNPIPGANQPTLTPTQTGNYTVQINNSCGSATSDPLYFNVTAITSIDDQVGFRVYPNPYKGQTNIYYNLKEPANVQLQIYNSLGQLVLTIVNQKQNPGKYTYEFSAVKQQLAAGSYLVKLQINDKTYSTQIVELK